MRKYDRTVLTDTDAWAAIRKWPLCPSDKWGWQCGKRCGPWVRFLPWRTRLMPANSPRLLVAGEPLGSTVPDGMWVSFGPQASYVDVVLVEHCKSRQNFYDKRSRYMPSLHSRDLLCPQGWFSRTCQVKGRNTMREFRWLCNRRRTFRSNDERRIPVRHVRVLYAMLPKDYDEFLLTPFSAHEFFCPHFALTQSTSPKLRAFVTGLSTGVHWYAR